jgi:hypothetical protein
MNTSEMTRTERDAVLMVNAYGVEVAVKVANTEVKTYAMNNNECVYWLEVLSHLVALRNKSFHK